MLIYHYEGYVDICHSGVDAVIVGIWIIRVTFTLDLLSGFPCEQVE